jgi:AcrR family transcriptional regulator
MSVRKRVSRPLVNKDRVRAVRRHPVQERTQRKVVQIIEAAAKLLERMPLDEITTTHIAKAAKVTTGTVYRFFPHREAIFESILIAYFEKFRSIYEDTLMHSKARTGTEIINEVIDIRVKLMLSEPGFHILWTTRDLPPQVLRRMRGPHGGIPALAKVFVAQRLGVEITPEIARRMELSGEITSAVLVHAFQKPEAERDAIIAELKRVLAFLVFGPDEAPVARPREGRAAINPHKSLAKPRNGRGLRPQLAAK